MAVKNLWLARGKVANAMWKENAECPADENLDAFSEAAQKIPPHIRSPKWQPAYRARIFHGFTALITTTRFLFIFDFKKALVRVVGCEKLAHKFGTGGTPRLLSKIPQ